MARIASDARTGIARSERVCVRSGWRPLAACWGLVGRRSRTRPTATHDPDPTRRAGGPPGSALSASSLWKPSRPSVGSARKEEDKNLRAIGQIGRLHCVGRITSVKHGAGPAVKTGNPSLSPRGALSAVGGIRGGPGIPGSRGRSSSTVLLAYSLVGGQAAARLEAVEWLLRFAREWHERRSRRGAADAVGGRTPGPVSELRGTPYPERSPCCASGRLTARSRRSLYGQPHL